MEKRTTTLLAIIIPMYNEATGAKKCITEVLKIMSTLPHTTLIIVNDGSTDATQKILEKEQKIYKKKLVIVAHQKNKGYGSALQTGIRTAKKIHAYYLLCMDSDLTNSPHSIPDFFKLIPQNYDCVKASRYIAGGKMVGVPAYRQLLSKLANSFARFCFQLSIHDYTNGFRMIKRTVAEKIPYTANDFSIIVEEMFYLKKRHANITEIPTTLTSRKKSTSHFSYSLPLLLRYARYTIQAAFI